MSATGTAATSTPPTGSPAGDRDADARDLRLLSAAFDGDPQAVGVIYDEHADSLYRFACFALDGSSQAQDVVVDVVVQACTAPGLLAGPGEGGLRVALARRTYERCLELRPPGAAPSGTVVAVCLYSGCSSREVALVLGVDPVDLPRLLTRDLQVLAGPGPSGDLGQVAATHG